MSMKFLYHALSANGLTANEKLMLIVLADIANERGSSLPSASYLTELTGMSKSTVRRTLTELKSKQLITKERRFNDGAELAPLITLTFDNQLPEHATAAQVATKKPATKSARPESVDEVAEYCRERKNNVDPEAWWDHYAANGWRVGRNPMKDWRACVRTWERNSFGSDKRSITEDMPLL